MPAAVPLRQTRGKGPPLEKGASKVADDRRHTLGRLERHVVPDALDHLEPCLWTSFSDPPADGDELRVETARQDGQRHAAGRQPRPPARHPPEPEAADLPGDRLRLVGQASWALALDQRHRLRPEDKATGGGIILHLHDGIELTLGDLVYLMPVGHQIAPSFMGRTAPIAMHGYTPDDPVMDACFVTTGLGTDAASILDVAPAIWRAVEDTVA